MKKIYIILAIAGLFSACKPSINITTTPTAGGADFTNYLAIGDAYTAGYADTSLTVSGQLNSFPQRLYEQFSMVPGKGGAKGNFIQPLLHSDNGYPWAKLVLGYTHNSCTTDSMLSPIDYPYFLQDPIDAQRYTWPLASYNNGQINNIGVPGMRVADYCAYGYGSISPYAKRFFKDISMATTPLIELSYRVHNLHPSFFTMWMGTSDVLGYAANGGFGGNGTGVDNLPQVGPGFYNPIDITPYDTFFNHYDSALQAAISTGAAGALINIPDITQLPFLTTIHSNGFVVTRQTQADSLNNHWANNPQKITFHVGNNQYVVQDHNNNIRQSVPGELILLNVPQDGLNCKGWGSTIAIPNKYVLTTEELQYIRAATQTFNLHIYTVSTLYHLAYVDINKFFQTFSSDTGVTYNGVNYHTNFVSGGVFSLDGVHLTQRGYALVANEIIRTINDYYKSTLTYSDVNKYHGVLFP